jgi:hypothetical protein
MLPMGAPVTEADPMPSEVPPETEADRANRPTEPIKVSEALRIPEELRVTTVDWAREPHGKSEPSAAVRLPEVAHEKEEVPSEDVPADDILTEDILPTPASGDRRP